MGTSRPLRTRFARPPGLATTTKSRRTTSEEEWEDDDEEEEESDDDGTAFDEGEIRAWVTIVSADGTIRHRHLECLPTQLLHAVDEARAALAELPPAEVPPERIVAEGMWIDEAKKSVGLWGSQELRDRLPDVRQAWQGWTVEWAERGYRQQCEIAGPAGVPLDDAEALAKILPAILSTKRFDMSVVLGVLGGGLRKTAMKATGCLLAVICLPLLIFGLVSGDWKAVLISIAITCGEVIVVFKTIEHRFKKSFQSKLPGSGVGVKAPPAAGPLDESMRRRRVDELLAAAGLPSLAKVEPLFSQDDDLDLLD